MSRFPPVALLCALLALLVARPARAQDGALARVEVRVTAVAGPVAHLDRGLDAGIEPGDRVLFYPLGLDVVQGTIRSVSERTSEATLDAPGAALDIGTRGEVLVPEQRFAPAEDAADTGGAPAHAPWTYEEGDWDQEMPLLADVKTKTAAERDPRVSGYAYWMVDFLDDREGTDSKDYFTRLGADVLYENPFGRGGWLHADLETNWRAFDLDGEEVEDETHLRIDRLSYAWGGTRGGSPGFWQVGRFLPTEFPELGVTDGAEYVHRGPGGDRWGASAGFQPEPDADFETGDDFQTSVFYRAVGGEREELSLGVAAQKTWHAGDEDRDLLLATLRWFPRSGWNAYATAWVDFYGSEDVQKDSGAELTQLDASLGYRWERGDGVNLSFARIRFPELLRDEIYAEAAEADSSLFDSRTDRLALSGWLNATDDIRLYARADAWDDEDDDGGGGEVRIDWQDLVLDRSRIGAALFTQDGEFSSVVGTRLDFQCLTSTGSWGVLWEIGDYEQDGVIGEQESLAQQRLRGTWDVSTSGGWSFSLYGEKRFGDELDALAAGIYLQRSF